MSTPNKADHAKFKGKLAPEKVEKLIAVTLGKPGKMLATKAIVIAYFVEGKSYAAIGREFGISRSSAYNRIARFFDICPLLK